MFSYVLENLAAAWQRGGAIALMLTIGLVIGLLLKAVWHIESVRKAKEERALAEVRRRAAYEKEREQYLLRLRVEQKNEWL